MRKKLDADCGGGKEGRCSGVLAPVAWTRHRIHRQRSDVRRSVGPHQSLGSSRVLHASSRRGHKLCGLMLGSGLRPLGGSMTLRRQVVRDCWHLTRVVRSPLVLPLLFFALAPPRSVSAQQTGTITGVVRAQETGTPLRDARVTIAGTRFNARTDSAGQYTIVDVPPGTYRIQAQIIGYGLGDVPGVVVTADQSTTADFRLTQLAIALQEVVVVGYGTQVRRDVTGSVTSVGGNALHDVPKVNALEAIKGRVPGVDIVTTGNKPGDGVRVRLRGERSLKASNDPLYVLDGIPMAGGIGDMTPRDIEPIEVLTHAAPTASSSSRRATAEAAPRASPTSRTAACRRRCAATGASTAPSSQNIGASRSVRATTTSVRRASPCAIPPMRSSSGATGPFRHYRPAGGRTGRTWSSARGRKSAMRSASRAAATRPTSP